LEDDLLVGLAVGAAVTSSWKIIKRPEFFSLRRICEVVVELVISGVEEKLTFVRDSEKKVSLRGVRGPSWLPASL
jgi:hypothetical protein